MKCRYLPYAIVMLAGFANGPSYAFDSLALNFSGTISSAACAITSGDGQDVMLGDVSTTYFGNPGDVSPAKTFSLVLDCPSGGFDKATVTFSGAADSVDPTLLALDGGTGVASGIAVRINESDGTTQVKLNEPSTPMTLIGGASNTLQFTAQYVALVNRPQIGAGAANATAQFTINYP